MGFPQLANIDKRIFDTISSRTGNNVGMSQKQPWVKVTSTLGNFLSLESIRGTETFAQRYGDTNKSGRVGVDKEGNSIYGTADGGFYQQTKRGFRPSPTIDSISISQGNEGLSKKVSFTINAYTKDQANTVISYFLEPGVHCLVEWGFNEAQSVGQKADLSELCNVVKYKNIAHIQQKRRNSNGTYDAMLAIITGGNTTFGDNESYNIEVELTSIGEMPAYLQHHKNIQTFTQGDLNATSKRFEPAEFEVKSEEPSAKEIGESLFKQMFNDLPGHKRINKVRNLINEEWATNPANFVNMDRFIRKELTEEIKSGQLALTSNTNREQLANEISPNDVSQGALTQEGEDVQKQPIDTDSFGGASGGTGGSVKGKIPSDQPLFSDRRYIRVALAFTIMEMQPGVSEEIPIICEDGATVSPMYISWQNTICRAHKHMYSVDPNTLYIPNKYHPRFRIEGAFADPVREGEGENEKIIGFTNPIPNLLVKKSNGSKEFNDSFGNTINDMHPNPHGAEKYSYFPSNDPLEVNDQKDGDVSFETMEANAHNWGYLRNLYIDFDFFCRTIEQSSYLSKDIMYTLLNGLSQGVNMMWEFQIVEKQSIDYNDAKSKNGNDSDPFYQWYCKNVRGNKNGAIPTPGQEELHVVDMTFFGKRKSVPTFGRCAFQSRGINSPFTAASLKFDIPASMKGQVVGQRKKGGKVKNPNAEQKEKDFTGLFSENLTDEVAELIYLFNETVSDAEEEREKKEKEQAKDAGILSDEEYNEKLEKNDKAWYEKSWDWISKSASDVGSGIKGVFVEADDIKEVRNANYELVLSNANVIPYIQDRKANLDLIQGFFDLNRGNNSTLDVVARVSTWRDTQILRTIKNLDEAVEFAQKGEVANIPLLPIEFEFTLPGVSGFKIGDTFSITDLPRYYDKVFQVVEVSHSIEQSIWTTTVRGKLRNEKADVDGELKVYEDKV